MPVARAPSRGHSHADERSLRIDGLASASDRQVTGIARGDILPVLKRVLSENARDYTALYVAAIACLLAVAAATAFIPWVMRPLIDDVFYREQYHLIPWICGAIAAVFVVRG